MPGSFVSTAPSRSAACAEPSAIVVAPADCGLAAEAVDGHEVGVRGGVEERVQDRPVGDAVGAVEHALGLAHGRRDRARVEVVARERDRAGDAAARDRLVDEQAELAAVAVAEPADARGQARELHGLARGRDPVRDRLAREVLEDDVVDRVDVLRVARDREPAERADALAEERPDVALREDAHVEGVADAEHLGARAQAVAVLEDLGAAPLELEHGADVVDQRGVGAADQLVAVAAAQLVGLGRRHAARDVAADRVGRRLIGDDVGRDAALDQRVHDVGDVGDEPDRDRLAALLGAQHHARAPRRGRRCGAAGSPRAGAGRRARDRPRRRASPRPRARPRAAARRPCRRGPPSARGGRRACRRSACAPPP